MYYSRYSELYHHGVKGQKWGVRRFQNENGSLTDEGKRRYGYSNKFETVRTLNKIEQENYGIRKKRAVAKYKADRAAEKGNEKKFEKNMAKVREYDKSIRPGEKLTKKILSNAKKKGYSIDNVQVKKYANFGKRAVMAYFATPIAAVQLYNDAERSKKYGPEAGGIHTVNIYSLRK